MRLTPKQIQWLVAVGCVSTGVVIGYLIERPWGRPDINNNVRVDTSSRKTVVIAGDISCDKNEAKTTFACRSDDTAALITSLKPNAVLTAGDNQYPNGTLESYQESYDKTWGAFKEITRPTPGNHEYNTSGASGYYDYFGERAGQRSKGYYSYKIDSWLMLALNSEIDVSSDSEQVLWLKQTLKDNRNVCALAYWHQPRFSTGGHPSNAKYDVLWRVLYDHSVDIVVNGHSHGYERYAPQNPDGGSDPEKGITQFVSGMGGSRSQSFSSLLPNLVTRQNHAFGVLRFTLYPKAAHYAFVPIKAQQTYSDSGVVSCH